MKKRILFSLVVSVVTAIIMFAMITTPLKYRKYKYNQNDILSSWDVEDAEEMTGDTVVYKLDNHSLPSEYMSVEINPQDDLTTLVKVYLYNDSSEEHVFKQIVSINEGEKYAAFTLPAGEYNKIVIKIQQGIYIFEDCEFHSGEHIFDYEKVYPSKNRVILAVTVSVVMFIIAFIADMKFKVTDKALHYFKKTYKSIAKDVLCLVIITFLAVITEVIIINILSLHGTQSSTFNTSRLAYIETLYIIIAIFIFAGRSKTCRIENVVPVIILAMGVCMISINAPKHSSWDTNSHYQWALNASSLSKTYVSQADIDFYLIEDEVYVQENRQNNLRDMKQLNNQYSYVEYIDRDEISIAHYPAGIAIALARLFRLPFTCVYKAGELGNIILYSILCYLGMRKLKGGKLIYAVIAMFPTNIFLASSYSYDFWVTGFSMMGMAYFIGNCQDKDKYISTKDTIIMVSAFALACVPKQIYIMLLIIPFFMPLKKIKNKKIYYLICCSGFILLALSFIIRAVVSTQSGSGDMRGGSGVDPAGQVTYIMSNISGYIKRVFEFALQYISFEHMKKYMIEFAYLGNISYGSATICIIMIIAAITDKCEEDNYKSANLVRWYAIGSFVITIGLIITALYINFTPVAAQSFNGCQPRYIVPLLYPLLSTVGSYKIINKMNKKIYYYTMLGIVTIIGMTGIYATMLTRML